MAELNEQHSDVDGDIDNLINKFNDALGHPKEISTTGKINDIEHLFTSFDLDDSEEFSEIIKEVIQNSISYHTIPSDNITKNQLPTEEFKDKSTKSSVTSFFQRLLGRKRNPDSAITLLSIPSVNSANDEQDVDAVALQAAEQQIRELADQGPAGIVHLSPLSREINRKIQVWSSSMTLCHEIGKERSGEALNVQFHSNPNGIPGHWTLLGNEDPKEFDTNLNDCLFEVIAAQTGHQPAELRAATVERMKKNIRSLSRRIEALTKEKGCGRIILMIGGARYSGRSANDAGEIIDKSQNGRCHPGHQRGHARGHTSNPGTTDSTGSAENYSRSGWKTAFLSREEQNEVAHQALMTTEAKRAMEELNRGGESRSVRIPVSTLKDPPIGAHFNDGILGQRSPIKELVLVLRHHAGHAKDPDHDVFVHTFYPVLEE